jgi:hypothetical protein
VLAFPYICEIFTVLEASAPAEERRKKQWAKS